MGIKNRTGKHFKLLLYLVIAILVNVAGVTLFHRFDLTKNQVFSISPGSKKVVSTLSEPLTVDVFFTRNLPAPYNGVERYLHDLLDAYALAGNRHFNYRFYDVSPAGEASGAKASDNRKLAENYGVYPVQIQTVENDEIKVKNAYMGLVLIHGDSVDRIPAITSTDGLEYKLTTAMQRLNHKVSTLLALPEKIQVKMVMSSSLNAVAPLIGVDGLEALPGKVKEAVTKLNAKNYGKLAYTYLDPSKDPALAAKLDQYHLVHLKWPAVPDRNLAAGEGTIGLVITYRDKTATVPLLNVYRIPIIGTHYELTDLSALAETINNQVDSLIGINENLGYLTGHGTLDFGHASSLAVLGGGSTGNVSSFTGLASADYTLKPVDLEKEGVPDDLKCLIIAHPTKPFSEYELYQIDQALMRGTNLAIFLDPFKANAYGNRGYGQGPTSQPNDTGLEKLLKHYGVDIGQSYVLDKNCYKQRSQNRFGASERSIYVAPLIKSKFINRGPSYMKNIKGLVTMKNAPVELDRKKIKENGLKAQVLFSSSDRSWEASGQTAFNPLMASPPASDKEMKSFPLACLLEGKFPSYFAGKPIPEKTPADPKAKTDAAAKPSAALPGVKESGNFIAKGRQARIFLVGTSALLTDNLLDAQGKTPDATFVMNVIDHLNHHDAIAVMRGKVQSFNPIGDQSVAARQTLKAVNIAGLPLLTVLFGLFVWLKRRARKKRIQLTFNGYRG
jgi:ABC-2 type transport system permease protein